MSKNLEKNISDIAINTPSSDTVNVDNLDDLFVLQPHDWKDSERLDVTPYSYWKSVFRIFIRKPGAIIAILSLIILIGGSIIIPMFNPIPFDEFFSGSIDLIDLAPSSSHIWGTDGFGRDLFYVVWGGAKKSIILALISSLINTFVGVLIGLVWGYVRKIDKIMIEVYNFIVNIPSLLIYMLLSTLLTVNKVGTPEFRLVLSLCMTGWLGMARFVRNQILIINNREYNVASKTLGTPGIRIMSKNLLPFVLSVIITEISLMIPSMISMECSLSFFGLGLPNNSISIGAALINGMNRFSDYPWQLIYPAIILSFIILAFFLLGVSLSDALDPKKHR